MQNSFLWLSVSMASENGTEKWEEPLGEEWRTWHKEADAFVANFIIVA